MNLLVKNNFRGSRALIICAAGKDQAMLIEVLRQLGVHGTVYQHESEFEEVAGNFDFVLFDDELGRQSSRAERVIDKFNGPAIALISSDAPSSVSWVIERNISGHITRPIRKAGVLANLIIAHHNFRKNEDERRRMARLECQVRARQIVCTAAIEISELLNVSTDEAFSILRSASMSRRLSMEDISAMIVSGEIKVPALRRGDLKGMQGLSRAL